MRRGFPFPQTVRTTLLFDSRDRNPAAPGESSSRFTVDVPELHNVSSARIVSAELPLTYYTFSEGRGNTSMTLSVEAPPDPPIVSQFLPVNDPVFVPDSPPLVRFSRDTQAHLVSRDPIRLDVGTNGGFTAVAMVRFAGPPGGWERIIDFASGPGRYNKIFGRLAETDDLIFQMFNDLSTPVSVATVGGAIEDGVWMAVACRYRATEGGAGVAELFKWDAAVPLASAEVLEAVEDHESTSNFIGRSNFEGDAYLEGDVSRALVYDRALDDGELAYAMDFVRDAAPDAPPGAKATLLAADFEPAAAAFNAAGPRTVTIPDGIYTPAQMAGALEAALNEAFAPAPFGVTFDPVTRKTSIVTPGTLTVVAPRRGDLAHSLGFPAGEDTTGGARVTGALVADLSPERYVLLDIPELNGVVQCLEGGSSRTVFAKIPLTVSEYGLYDVPVAFVMQRPVISKLSRLHVTLRFHDGSVVDLNGCDWSFGIEFTSTLARTDAI